MEMEQIVVSGTGMYIPPNPVSNEELVAAFNAFCTRYNQKHAAEIASGAREALRESSSDFILKASGIRQRSFIDREGILDSERLCPRVSPRTNEQISVQAEFAVQSAKRALEKAGRTPADVDGLIVACSSFQRGYPAIAIETQAALGTKGWAIDMNMACSSAAFGIQAGTDSLRSGNAKGVIVVSPEITSAHLNFKDRDSHFIFGDGSAAVFLELESRASAKDCFRVIGTRCISQFSNNIRNNFGFMNRCERDDPWNGERGDSDRSTDKLFVQEGRKVFKEVVPLVSELILNHLGDLHIEPKRLERLWLHQANIGMNQLIAQRVLGREVTPKEAPQILQDYGNTSSAGSIIAMHLHHEDLKPGALGLLCAFGAGYSAGSVLLQRL